MSYETGGIEGRGQRGGRLQDDSRAFRDEVEEEPTDLDAPASDGLDDDELEDVTIKAEEVDDEGSDDEEEEAASPLAEDAPVSLDEEAEESEEDGDGAEDSETHEQEDDLDATPGVRRSGRGDVGLMTAGARRREFPTAAKAASKRKRKPARRAKMARA